VVKDIDAGFIAVGQNWHGKQVVDMQKLVLGDYYKFKTPNELFWNWQYTTDDKDETKKSYYNAIKVFDKTFDL
jgi:hypothetical protein